MIGPVAANIIQKYLYIFSEFVEQMCIRDRRGGAALVAAGLAATGTTIVKNSHFIERGYENLEQVITELGGRISLKEE